MCRFCLLLVKVYKQKRVVFSDATDNDIQYVFIDEFCGLQEEITEDTLEIFGNGVESKGWFFRISSKTSSWYIWLDFPKKSRKAEFRINSFAFVSTATEPADDAEVYMHCEVWIN